jgi:hypothetical protein
MGVTTDLRDCLAQSKNCFKLRYYLIAGHAQYSSGDLFYQISKVIGETG